MAGVSREYISRLESGKVALTEEIKIKFQMGNRKNGRAAFLLSPAISREKRGQKEGNSSAISFGRGA